MRKLAWVLLVAILLLIVPSLIVTPFPCNLDSHMKCTEYYVWPKFSYLANGSSLVDERFEVFYIELYNSNKEQLDFKLTVLPSNTGEKISCVCMASSNCTRTFYAAFYCDLPKGEIEKDYEIILEGEMYSHLTDETKIFKGTAKGIKHESYYKSMANENWDALRGGLFLFAIIFLSIVVAISIFHLIRKQEPASDDDVLFGCLCFFIPFCVIYGLIMMSSLKIVYVWISTYNFPILLSTLMKPISANDIIFIIPLCLFSLVMAFFAWKAYPVIRRKI